MACFTAWSSSCPRRRYTISSLFQTVGGSAARSPEQITSSDSSFCRFFRRMLTTSVAVQAPKAISTSSIGPGAVFEWRSESKFIAWPEGLVARNFSSPTHFTDAVCITPPKERIAGAGQRNELDGESSASRFAAAHGPLTGIPHVGTPTTSSRFQRMIWIARKKPWRSAMQLKSGAIRWGGALAFALAVMLLTGHELLSAGGNAIAAETKDQPYVIEYYYKAKWGHADEFLTLFKKNHYPVLKKEMELGRMLKVTMAAPRYHATEDGRWDFRVTIVYKNAAIANDNFDSGALIKQLFPDQDIYKREEQRRFEILESHSDVPIKDVDLDGK